MAAKALGNIGGTDAIAALGAAQSSLHPRIRKSARNALALINLRQAANGEEADAGALRELAAAHIVRREFRQALQWLDRAGRMEPDNAETFETLGTLHHKLGDHAKAEGSYKRAVELSPDEPFPHFGLGVIYQSREKRSAALDAFNRYVDLAPNGEQAGSARQFIAELSEK
jgi:Flp pilus assembly protein TadD